MADWKEAAKVQETGCELVEEGCECNHVKIVNECMKTSKLKKATRQ